MPPDETDTFNDHYDYFVGTAAKGAGPNSAIKTKIF